MITTVEAFVLAVMTVIVVAIAIPSYVDDQGSRTATPRARSQLREAGEAAETYRADTGSYLGHVTRRSGAASTPSSTRRATA